MLNQKELEWVVDFTDCESIQVSILQTQLIFCFLYYFQSLINICLNIVVFSIFRYFYHFKDMILGF